MDNVEVIIFDLDNTLINYGGVTKQAWSLTCQKLVKEFDLLDDANVLTDEIIKVNDSIWEDEEKRPKGNFSFQEIRRSIVSVALNHFGIDNQDYIDYLVENYATCKHQAVYLFEDVKETLTLLRQRGYHLALLTNGDGEFQREKVKRFDIENLVDKIFIEGEQGVGKPEKQAYQNVCDAFDVPLSKTCMIGDHFLWEVVAPIEYGMHAIWVNRGALGVKGHEDVQADYVIENINELLDIFR